MIESAGLSPEDVGATDSSAGTADAVIIGAGLAGLAAATTIAAARHSVVVLEASDGVGGRVRSDLVDGFVLDRGFQVLLTAYPELVRHLDVAALDLCSFEPGADVWHDGRCAVVGDPFRRPRTLVATAAAPIGSVADKLRLGRLWLRLRRAEPRQLLRGADSTTAAELRRLGFSAAMIERFWRPLIAGVQLDPDLTTSRRMFDVILRCLLTGNSAVPAGGMGAISAQLADRLPPGSIHLGVEVVEAASGRARSADGRNWTGRTVVVATEGPVAARLLDLPPVASRPVGCVYFATVAAPTGSKRIQLGTHDGHPVNAAVMSNVAASYAPPDQHLVVVALPGAVGHDDLDGLARRALGSWWGSPVDSWRTLRTYWIEHGQPDQRPPFSPKQRVALGEHRFVCGDHRDTASIQGALYSGRRCGEAVVAELSHGT